METLPNRRTWITKENLTICQIFAMYPRLIDYKGEMIENDFKMIFQGVEDNFIKKFPSYYCPRILAYAKINSVSVYKRFKHISNYSNSTRIKKSVKDKSKKMRLNPDDDDDLVEENMDQTSFLLQVVSEGTSLSHFIAEFRKKSKANVQPYIICVKGQNRESYFLQGDGWIIKTFDETCAVSAFDLLFKLYFVLNVCYPSGLLNFYNFMEQFIYKMPGTKVRNVVRSLHI
ncbi:uncharacterized protein LOC122510577 isoform X2 [Leptopilina heterotoma]|nr:uncharacterized protein LOC122510577 isoform X2 [Leptopilina heterotoma]